MQDVDKVIEELKDKIVCLEFQNENLDTRLNAVYKERNTLVALLSSILPSSLERHDESDENWEDDWRWIVFVMLPGGKQASWHIHDSDLKMFSHVTRRDTKRFVWDGHTTEEKYDRVFEAMGIEDAAMRKHLMHDKFDCCTFCSPAEGA